MKSLKELSQHTVQNKSEAQQEENTVTDDLFIESSLIEGSQFYMFGVYECYCFMKGIDSLLPEDVMKKLKSLPSVEKEKGKEFLRSSDDDFYKFLSWYFYEYKK